MPTKTCLNVPFPMAKNRDMDCQLVATSPVMSLTGVVCSLKRKLLADGDESGART
jgi:hypothetical protein